MSFFNKTKGAVSIFLVLILVPMMTVAALFVDASKVKLATGVAESAGDLALNTALTSYDTQLKNLYGLFATAQDTDELFSSLEDYYRSCITSSGVTQEDADNLTDTIMAQLGIVNESGNADEILNMKLTDFSAQKKSGANLADAVIIKKQIVDFMKYRAPINTGLSFISSLNSFATLSEQSKLVEKRQAYYKAEETVLENAKKAWENIALYNIAPFATGNKKTTYFPQMKTDYSGYESQFKSIAEKIIKDLYDSQSYGTFSKLNYYIAKDKVTVNDVEKNVYFFYYTSKNRLYCYTELSTYTDKKRADEDDLKTLLQSLSDKNNAVKNAKSNMIAYDSTSTYKPQYLIQTNRNSYYGNYMNAVKNYYSAYTKVLNAYEFRKNAGEASDIKNSYVKVNNSTQKIETVYSKLVNQYENSVTSTNNTINTYNTRLSSCASETNTDITATNNEIKAINEVVTKYKKDLINASDALAKAIVNLEAVYNAVKDGGSLDKAKNSWNSVATSGNVKDTALAKQDQAEIKNLNSYFSAEDVKELIEHLKNVKTKLGDTLDQMATYKFFGTNIEDITDYEKFKAILTNNIGAKNIKSVSTKKTSLQNQIDSWCNGKFTIEKSVNTDWSKQSDSRSNIEDCNLSFYNYLNEHFGASTSVTLDDSGNATNVEAKEDDANGKSFYESIKNAGKDSAETKVGINAEGKVTGAKGGKEIKDLAGKPSAGNASETPSITTVNAGDDAASKSSSALSSLFSEGFLSAIKKMGTDLRDNLYVADYVISMFSYDTVESEFKNKNKNAQLNLLSLTKESINEKNNYAYGKEVEYVIYGGSNTSNTAKAYGTIYGIRFGFNLIYAFMDSSIRDTAFAVATPISAATLGVIPVPLIQSVIIIAIACCESGLDLASIRDGNAVPLFKNQNTWKTSVKGIITTAKSAVGSALKETASTVIDGGMEMLNTYLDKTDEELNAIISEKGDDIISSVSSAYDTIVTNNANIAIQKLTTLCNNAIEESYLDIEMTTEEIEQKVIAELDNWIKSEGQNSNKSDLAYIAKKEAVNIIKSQHVGKVLSVIKSSKEQAKSSVQSVANDISSVLDAVRKDLVEKTILNASSAISSYKSEMIKKIGSSMQEGADSLKNTLNTQLDGIFGNSSSATAGSNDVSGISSLLEFSYSDYLRLFLIIGMYSGQQGILLRTADVIQANISHVTGNSSYRLSNSAIYVEVSATVLVKPILVGLPIFAEMTDNAATNTKWYTINYNAIKGY